MRKRQRSKGVKFVIAEAGERRADASLLVIGVAVLVRCKSYAFDMQCKHCTVNGVRWYEMTDNSGECLCWWQFSFKA